MGEIRVRLYTIEEYLDVLEGTMEGFMGAAEDEAEGAFPFIGAAAVIEAD